MTRPHRKFSLHAALALALLFAQLGAQAHAYSHLKSAPDFLGSPVSQNAMCGSCMMGGPLLAAASAPVSTLLIHYGGALDLPCLATASLVAQAGHYAFRSRAPPHLV